MKNRNDSSPEGLALPTHTEQATELGHTEMELMLRGVEDMADAALKKAGIRRVGYFTDTPAAKLADVISEVGRPVIILAGEVVGAACWHHWPCQVTGISVAATCIEDRHWTLLEAKSGMQLIPANVLAQNLRSLGSTMVRIMADGKLFGLYSVLDHPDQNCVVIVTNRICGEGLGRLESIVRFEEAAQ